MADTLDTTPAPETPNTDAQEGLTESTTEETTQTPEQPAVPEKPKSVFEVEEDEASVAELLADAKRQLAEVRREKEELAKYRQADTAAKAGDKKAALEALGIDPLDPDFFGGDWDALFGLEGEEEPGSQALPEVEALKKEIEDLKEYRKQLEEKDQTAAQLARQQQEQQALAMVTEGIKANIDETTAPVLHAFGDEALDHVLARADAIYEQADVKAYIKKHGLDATAPLIYKQAVIDTEKAFTESLEATYKKASKLSKFEHLFGKKSEPETEGTLPASFTTEAATSTDSSDETLSKKEWAQRRFQELKKSGS